MKRVAIVQARMTSSRLPGKVLMDIAGAPMVARVTKRAARAARIDEVVVACTDRAADNPLAEWARTAGVTLVRGSETDVLGRFVAAAAAVAADVIVRITADCPLIDPAVIDRVVDALLEDPAADYAANVLERSYPRGLDTEAFTRDALHRMDRLGTSADSREHVTIGARLEHPEAFRLRNVRAAADDSDLRWTVDTAADLAYVRLLYQAPGAAGGCDDYRALVRWCRSNRDWARHDDTNQTWDPSRPAFTETEGARS